MFVVVVLCRIFGPAVLVGISLLFLGVRLVCFPPPFLPLRIDLSHAPTVIKGERREHPPVPLWAFDCSSKAIGGFAYTYTGKCGHATSVRSILDCLLCICSLAFVCNCCTVLVLDVPDADGLENDICSSNAAGYTMGTKMRSPYLLKVFKGPL